MYLKFIPQSLLPYPKNYIKRAYYIYLEKLQKEGDPELFNSVRAVATSLFCSYPNWEKYQQNLKHKSTYDDVIFKETYDASPSSIDATDEELVRDFGILPEIEEDIDFNEV